MADNATLLRRLSGFAKLVFLLCLAALMLLGVAEVYVGQNAPSETHQAYDTLEKIFVWVILACLFAWVVTEAWREILFLSRKSKSKYLRRIDG
jgi:cell division protein FtsW (lipid II flippase)